MENQKHCFQGNNPCVEIELHFDNLVNAIVGLELRAKLVRNRAISISTKLRGSSNSVKLRESVKEEPEPGAYGNIISRIRAISDILRAIEASLDMI